MALAIEKLSSALHPILCIQSHHQTGLVVQGSVLSVDASLECEVSLFRKMKEVSIISDVAIKSLPPEVSFRPALHDKLVPRAAHKRCLILPSPPPADSGT